MPLSRQDQGADAFDRGLRPRARSAPQRIVSVLRQCETLVPVHPSMEPQASLRPPLCSLSVDRAIAKLIEWHSFPEVWVTLLAESRNGFDPLRSDPSRSDPSHRRETAPTPYACHGYFDRNDLESELNQLLHRSPKAATKRTHLRPSPVAMPLHGLDSLPLQLDEQFDRIEAWLASIESEMPPAPSFTGDRLRPTSPPPPAPLATARLSQGIPFPAAMPAFGQNNASPSDPTIRYGATHHPESMAWRMLVQPSSAVPALGASTATWIASPETMAWTTMTVPTNQRAPSDGPRRTGNRHSRGMCQPTRTATVKRTVPGIGGRSDRSRPHRGKPCQRMPVALRDRDATAFHMLSSA